MALPTVTITVVLNVPATGVATTAATAVPASLKTAIGDEVRRLVRNQNPSSRDNSASGPVAGVDALAVTLTSVTVA